MQWIVWIVWWAGMVFSLHTGRRRAFRVAMACGLFLSMITQLFLLWLDGLLSLETALPLHLCGLFGVLSIPLLWHAPAPLWEASTFLAAPAAAITLFFPAVISCSHPFAMRLAFTQLHVLVALTPVFLWANGKPLPTDPRRTFILGSGYLCLIGAFNKLFGTNYLFLRAAPANTPLAVFLSHGTAFYVCSLFVLCTLIFRYEGRLFEKANRFTAGNT